MNAINFQYHLEPQVYLCSSQKKKTQLCNLCS